MKQMERRLQGLRDLYFIQIESVDSVSRFIYWIRLLMIGKFWKTFSSLCATRLILQESIPLRKYSCAANLFGFTHTHMCIIDKTVPVIGRPCGHHDHTAGRAPCPFPCAIIPEFVGNDEDHTRTHSPKSPKVRNPLTKTITQTQPTASSSVGNFPTVFVRVCVCHVCLNFVTQWDIFRACPTIASTETIANSHELTTCSKWKDSHTHTHRTPSRTQRPR